MVLGGRSMFNVSFISTAFFLKIVPENFLALEVEALDGRLTYQPSSILEGHRTESCLQLPTQATVINFPYTLKRAQMDLRTIGVTDIQVLNEYFIYTALL